MSKHIDPTTRVQNLEFADSWQHLSAKEKNYAYFMMKASWAGVKMVLHQLCYESPALFCIFQAYFQEKDFCALEEAAVKAGVSLEAWKHFIAYVGGFYGNLSNYHSFGDMKFVPQLSKEDFRTILYSHPHIERPHFLLKSVLDDLYPQVEQEIFAYDKPYTQINFPHEGGITGYFSRDMTPEDLKLVSAFLKSQKIDVLNTRVFKKADDHFILTVGSVQTDGSKTGVEFEGKLFDVQYGEFASYLEDVIIDLQRALEYAANDNQKQMIEKYIEHYRTGSIDVHKDSQRKWIADKGPVVESNMGWIETYIDPTNERAYYEGWVAIVDKVKSEKFQKLVKISESVIGTMPYPKFMEKEKFLAPDFTTLDIIGFATNSCPLGINIPNYDDIRETEGFKNVFLNNSLGSYAINAMQFATDEQSDMLVKNTIKCYEVHVACHELLGHGVGRLIYRNADGSMTKFVDHTCDEEFESCYEEGETWNSKFGAISTSYEECRADTAGFYLCQVPEVYELFGFEYDDIPDLLWCNVMNQFRKGILGLQLYNAETKKWGQAHTQGAYVFAQYIYQNQPCEIVRFEILPGGDDMRIHLDKEKLWDQGPHLIRTFMVILQTYKSSGCIERASKFYAHYSKVDGIFLQIRDIVINKKKPRRIELNNNLTRYNDTTIEPNHYPETFEGIIQSYADRFVFNQDFLEQVVTEWDKTKQYLKV